MNVNNGWGATGGIRNTTQSCKDDLDPERPQFSRVGATTQNSVSRTRGSR